MCASADWPSNPPFERADVGLRRAGADGFSSPRKSYIVKPKAMSLTPYTMLPLGTSAPDFHLPDTNGKTVSLSDFKNAPALVVVFMCNHCPYVKLIREGLAKFGRDCQAKGAAMVGISANDAANYPADSPAKMKAEAVSAGYT